MMPLPLDWYSSINVRRSRRNYNKSRPIGADLADRLERVCNEFRPFPGVRVEFVPRPSHDIFTNALWVYGNIRNVTSFFAFIGDNTDPNVQEKLGYTGEGLILEATSHGLGTCWTALSYKSKQALSILKLNGNEKLLAVSPVGYTADKWTLEEKVFTGFGANHERKPLASMVSGLEIEHRPEWTMAAVEAARLSPSAINRQPWCFHVEENSITISVKSRGAEFNVSKRLDCGIAMLHIELGALSRGIQGKWELLKQPRVARFQAVAPGQIEVKG